MQKDNREQIEETGDIVGLDIKKVDLKERRFSGYASLRTEDRGGDIVAKGAFGSVVVKNIAMLKDHDPTKVIGVWHTIKEDAKGLYVEGELLEGVQDADETLIKLRKKAVNGMSIGFRTLDADYERTTHNGKEKLTRIIKKLELWEVSVVTFPMHLGTRITTVKTATKRELQRAMQDAGLSRKQACEVLDTGYKALARDAKATKEPSQADVAELHATSARQEKTLNLIADQLVTLTANFAQGSQDNGSTQGNEGS
jgi:Escherichia/Staphylococcus phage prohead protease